MNKFLPSVLLLSGFMICTQARAESNWEVVALGENGKSSVSVLIDTNNITQSKNIVTAWQRLDVVNSPDNLVAVMSIIQSDCTHNTHKVLKTFAVYKDGVITNPLIPPVWEAVKDNTTEKSIHTFLCSTTSF